MGKFLPESALSNSNLNCSHATFDLWSPPHSHLSVMKGFRGGVEETDSSSPSSSASSSLEFWIRSDSSSSLSPSFFLFLADDGLLTPSIWLP